MANSLIESKSFKSSCKKNNLLFYVAFLIISMALIVFSFDLQPNIIVAPNEASVLAVTNPIPVLAPVMIMIFFDKSTDFKVHIPPAKYFFP